MLSDNPLSSCGSLGNRDILSQLHIYTYIYRIHKHTSIEFRNKLVLIVSSGVMQGDSLSPTLFGLFINGLIKCVKDLKLGIMITNELISISVFADDIVILAHTEEELQKMLKCIENSCKKWRLKVNTGKTNVMHFRNKRKKKLI